MVALSANVSSNRPEIFNVLFKEVYSDLKTSNSIWECISTRATKLAGQLNATASALSHFVDALQTVSDCANNVNAICNIGISRDIGAALTRYCIRQRSIESKLRKISQPLIGEFTIELERKCAEWKHSLADTERRHQRSCKRLKSLQAPQAEAEKRHNFIELLHMQRNHYAGFVALLLPIIGSQLDVLDENTHLRQVRDSMESTLNGPDAHSLVDALIEDITLCSSSSKINGKTCDESNKIFDDQSLWNKQVGVVNDNRKSSSQQHLYPSTSSMFVGQNKDDVIVCNRNSIPQQNSQKQYFWLPTQSHTSPTPDITHSNVPSRHRPPLPDAFIVSSSSACSSQNSPTNLIKNKQNFGIKFQQSLPCYSSNCSSSIKTVDSGTSYCYSNSEQQNIKMSRGGIINQRRPSSIGSTAIADPTNSINGSVTTNSSSAALIAETLQQIDRLGLELDNYCTGLDIVDNEEKKCYEKQENIITKEKQKLPPPVPPKRTENFCPPFNVKFRNDNNLMFGQQQNKTVQPPPLPERRNSTISAATPTAPSIADIRCAGVILPPTSMTTSMPIFFDAAIPSIKKQSSPSQIFNHVPNQIETLPTSISSFNYHNHQSNNKSFGINK
uniref:IMD domain-containing protein n=1 Tax=Meloidogyne hapla TaxID=6305 RepID=A0A1I8AYH2_MELHA